MKKYLYPALCIALICFFYRTQAQIISTVAGNGIQGYIGDGIPATDAEISSPQGVYVDGSGNLYIGHTVFASSVSGRILKVDPSGILTNIAGGGTVYGEGTPASNSILWAPYQITMDGSGNMYFSDVYNNRIRKIDAAGIITTVAGDGIYGSIGDGGNATAARLAGPRGIAVDGAGNVYFTQEYGVIRKVNPSGIISIYAGCSSCGPLVSGGLASAMHLGNDMRAMSIDASGNLYVAEGDPLASPGGSGVGTSAPNRDRVIKISTSGIVTVIAGFGDFDYSGDGGPATAAGMNPEGISLGPGGTLYISDYNNNRIRMVNAAGIISTIAGTGSFAPLGDGGPATAAFVMRPTGIFANSNGDIYLSDNNHFRVRKISAPEYSPSFIAGSSQSFAICEGSAASSIDALLAIEDANPGQTETWAIATDATHGTLSASYSATSTGGIITPSGLTYTPAPGYSGPDIFVIQISDGTSTVTTTVNVTVNPLPDAGTISGPSSVCVGASITLSDAVTGGAWSASNANATVSGGMVTGAAAGMDSIFYSVTNSCGTAVDTQIITINTIPDPGTLTGPSDVCLSASITLTPSVPSGTWAISNTNASITSAGIVTGASVGIDTALYIVSNTCGADTVTQIVTIGTVPSPSAITGASSVCEAASITLTGAVTGGTWNASNTHATITGAGLLTGVTAGVDTITYIMTNACGSTPSTKAVTINPLPVAGTITGTTATCVPGTLTLSDAVPGGTWASGNTLVATVTSAGIVSSVAPGTAVISYSVTNGCGTAVAMLTVSMNTAPVAATIAGPSNVCVSSSIVLTDALPGGSWLSTVPGVAVITASGIVIGMSTGTTLISYTVTNVCGTSTVTKVITVNPLPVAGSITGSDFTCIPSTITLAATLAGGSWSSAATGIATVNSTGVVTGIAPGTVVISYSVSNSCGTADATKTITISNMPDAGTITGTATVCVGSATFLSDATLGGTWSSSSANATVSPTGVVVGVAAGTATISYTVTNICGMASTHTNVTITPASVCAPPTGISPIQAAAFNVYPNPSHGTFTVVLPYAGDDVIVSVTDLLGAVVMTTEASLTGNTLVATLPNIAPGTYVIRVSTKSEIFRKKITIE